MPINCVFTLHDGDGAYYRNTYIALLSLLENTKSEIVAHIVHDETIKHGRADLENLCASYGKRLEFHPVPSIPADVVASACRNFHFAGLYRLCIHELVQADKILYFDSDLVFQCDVSELDAVELDGAAAAAAPDEGGHWKKSARVKKRSAGLVARAKFSPDTYFNAGVMVYDLRKMREASAFSNVFWEICREYYDHGLSMVQADQDILNIYCAAHGGVRLLDSRFNHLLYAKGRNYDGPESLRGKIVHYSAPQTKPGAVMFPAQLLYWKYYAMTPWGGDVFERINEVFFQPRMEFLKNYAGFPKRRRFLDCYAAGGLKAVIGSHLGARINGK